MSADVARGRRSVATCLAVIGATAVIVTVATVALAGTDLRTAGARLVVFLLMLYMIWRGRLWARLLVGVLVAIGTATLIVARFNNVPIGAFEAVQLAAALVYAAAFIFMVRSVHAQAFFLSKQGKPIPRPPNG